MVYPLTAPRIRNIFDGVENDLTNIKNVCLAVQDGTAAGGAVPAFSLTNLRSSCIAFRTDFAAIAGNVPLIQQLTSYVQQQKAGASTLAVGAEFSNLNTLCNNLLAAISSDYPRDGQGRLLDRTFASPTGDEAWVNLTALQLPNVMPAITAFLNAMN
jgi:hypothetical protein